MKLPNNKMKFGQKFSQQLNIHFKAVAIERNQ